MGEQKINKDVDTLIDALLETERDSYHSPLQSFEAHKEHEALQMREKVVEYKENIFEGHRLLAAGLTSEEDKERLNNCLDRMSEGGFATASVPRELLMTMYRVAYSFFEEKKLKQAEKVLVFLTFLDPYFPTFWIAQGRIQEELELPDLAIEAYKMAVIADPEDIEGYRNCIRCLLDAGRKAEANLFVDLGLKAAEDLPEFKEKMEQIKKYILKHGGK